MKMGKKVREYKSGDFIFAKVKGYPAWPARVQRPNGKKYFVYFYGTGETANLPPNMIFDYAENKDKFLSKSVKRRDFNDGVKQIEYDFANNVPLEQVIGAAVAVPAEGANDTANDTANNTMDDSAIDTTAAEDTTVADESAVNSTAAQNETAVEDSDETGALVIDEGTGKKGRKSTAKPTGKDTPKAVKEPKTPRGKKKDTEEKEEQKKEEEIVSRSGRKIRPKRYLDEQTEENATLPSPAAKKRRAVSPAPEKEKENKDKNKADLKPKAKHFIAVPQAELEDLKEPFAAADDPEKENILIAYLPQGQYVGIRVFQNRPNSFKNEAARLQWDKRQALNAITLKRQLEKGQITSQSVITQLVMDLNLSDEEKATLDKERETEEKKSRVQFLKTEMKLIELEAKIKTCLCLEKADTEMCLMSLDELTELDIKPLMLLKHPSCSETVKRLRAYVGNAPSWELSEKAALIFARQAHRIRRRADVLYRRFKDLFTIPEGLSFWEFFSERVEQFKKATAKLTPDELLELVHEPLEMSLPTSHTMKASIDAANQEENLEEDGSPKKKAAAKSKKPTNNSTPSKPALKRQSSRKQAEEKDKEKDKEPEANADETNEEATESADKTVKATDGEKENMETDQNAEEPMETDEVPNAEDKQEDSSKSNADSDKVEINKDKTESDSKTNEESSEKINTNNDAPEKETNDDTTSKETVENTSDKDNNEKDSTEKNNEEITTEKDTEKDTTNEKNTDSEKDDTKEEETSTDKNKKDSDKNSKKESSDRGKKKEDTEKKTRNNSSKDNSKSKSPSPSDKPDNNKSPKESKGSETRKSAKDDKAEKEKSNKDKSVKEDKTEKAEEKDKEDEPRAKRSRETKKTDAPPPRSPAKRKSKF